jgi:RNA 3'-terminal phosphate cyclase (RTC)-like protein
MTKKHDSIIDIDGSRGEGGGQVVRVAFSLAAITSQAVRVNNIRANRPKGGKSTHHQEPGRNTPTTSTRKKKEKKKAM